MRLRFVPALLAAAMLAGCSIPLMIEPDPLEDATAVYSWQAEGRMIFECTYDTEGFYWAFVRPEGSLTSETGRIGRIAAYIIKKVSRIGTARISKRKSSARVWQKARTT